MGSAIPRRVVTDALVTRLETIPNLTVYLRRVGFVRGVTDAPGGQEVPPPTVSVTDRRVRPYVVVYPTAGMNAHPRLDYAVPGLVWDVQLTCVAGDESAIDPVVDLVTGCLDGWRPVFPGPYDQVVNGPFAAVPGYDPGPVRRDDDVTPARFWTPLEYRVVLGA